MMTFASNPSLSTLDRPLTLSTRRDIQITPVSYSGQMSYVLKDPMTLEFAYLTAEEFFLFEQLREPTTLGQLRREFEKQFAPQQISPEALQHGVNQLYRQGLLVSETAGQGRELVERGAERRRAERWQSLVRLLSIRLGSVDATNIVDGLYARLRWIFSTPVALLALTILVYAAWILLGQGREVVSRLPSIVHLTQPRFLLLWVGTIAGVKVIHELAHALACKHLGGRCHELGVLLLAFMPCLYCDVSDAWRLVSKWQRIAVSAAGMAVELIIAAAALIAWWHTEPGLLNTWCLGIVIICSVGTLLVNANPLLRYDGYYILADLWEVPNLSGRSQGLLAGKFRRWLLDEPAEEDPLLGPGKRRSLLFYAMAAKLYLAILIVSIFAGLLALARPYRAENMVFTLAAITLAGMLWGPARSLWRMWHNPLTRSRVRRPRLAVAVGLLAAVTGLVFLYPVGHTVSGPVVFVPVESQAVYAATAGELRWAAAPGTRVEQGDVVARLANPGIELALAKQRGETEVRRVRTEQLQSLRSWNSRANEQLPTAHAALADARNLLAEQSRQAEQLVLTAPAAGVVIAPPDVPDDNADPARLPNWSGSPLEVRNLGCWLESGTILCTVVEPGPLAALVAIDEANVSEIKRGQSVSILMASTPVRILRGEITEVAQRGVLRADAPAALQSGRVHIAKVVFETQDSQLLVGSRGTAKIAVHRRTLGSIVADYLRHVFRLPW